MAPRFVIGVDCGTSSTKVILFSETGEIAAEQRVTYPIINPKPGWAEQKAEWWWDAFVVCVRELLKECPEPEKIEGISITHQRITAVPVDKNVEPIRNAILWNDLRCSSQNRRALKTLDASTIYSRTGYLPGIWTVYKVMWLKDHEPDIYDRTFKIILVQDYLAYKLTGRLFTTCSSAATTGCLDIQKKDRWANDIIEAFGLSPSLFVPEILEGGEVAGFVSGDAAAQTGLKKGLPVVVAAGDQPCGALGSGVISTRIGCINGGTSCTLETCAEELRLGGQKNFFIEISPTGGYLLENSVPSGGSSLMKWLKDSILEEKETPHAETDWDCYSRIAERAAPGNLGLILIPYLSGSNAPYWDVDSRGILLGLSLDHGKAHLIRAIVEGLAYEIRRQKDLMESEFSEPVGEVRMYGGMSKSGLWNRTFANILGVTVCTLETAETTALGAAICAAKGVGIYGDFKAATKNMVRIKNQYHPDRELQTFYDTIFAKVYSQFYDRVADTIKTLTEIISERQQRNDAEA